MKKFYIVFLILVFLAAVGGFVFLKLKKDGDSIRKNNFYKENKYKRTEPSLYLNINDFIEQDQEREYKEVGFENTFESTLDKDYLEYIVNILRSDDEKTVSKNKHPFSRFRKVSPSPGVA